MTRIAIAPFSVNGLSEEWSLVCRKISPYRTMESCTLESSLKIALVTPFVEAIKETFSTMVALELRQKEVYVKQNIEMFGELSAVVGLSGATTGTCTLSMSAEVAEELVRAMLMTPEGETLSHTAIFEGVGDLAHLTARGAEAKLSSTRYQFCTIPPVVVSGGDHKIFYRTSFNCVVIVLENSKGQSIALELCVDGR